MNGPADQWQVLGEAFLLLGRHIDQARTVNINAASLRGEARDVAQLYFRQARPALQNAGITEELEILDGAFQRILELSDHRNAAASYKKQIKRIRKILPKVTGRIELNQTVSETIGNTNREDERLIQTLEGLVPSAALSYRQAILDLADDGRISFRGPALELREALRETLDYLAPDNDVIGMPGFTLEKNRTGPTMKQKVRFILKSRGQSKASSSVPEQTTSTVDEMIGTLTRSIYERSSAATHVASERKTVNQVRRYVVAVMHDILEL